MFEIDKQKIEIVDKAGNKNTYEIGPLTGEYLEDLFTVIDAFQKVEGKTDTDVIKILGSDIVRKLHNIVYASLAQSYPEQAKDKVKLSQFVSLHLIKFIEPVMKANIPQE